jgi:phage host-nuclease inhibitor protein Gam
MVKGKAAAADVRIPQNREEAAEMIAEFGAAARDVALIETAMQEQLAKVKQDSEKDAAPHVERAKQLFAGLKIYCEANRQTLLGNTGLKTVQFSTGTVAWRFKPSKVTVSGGAEEVIARIVAKAAEATERGDAAASGNYLNFLRTKHEIDKDSMLKSPDLARTIDGIKIGRGGETFEVEPFGAELSEAAQ